MNEREFYHWDAKAATVDPPKHYEISVNDDPWVQGPVQVTVGDHVRLRRRATLLIDPIPTWAFLTLIGVPALMITAAIWMMP